MTVRPTPEAASIADPAEGVKLHAPSAARNRDAICDLLIHAAPRPGPALELASGTGQHVTAFAARLPHLAWQPTEVDPARLASIDAHVAEAGLANVAPAVWLDASEPGWAATRGGQSLIVLVNLLHLISDAEAATIIGEAARALAPGGTFVVYGPFMRAGELTSAGDAAFHARLVASDPEIGYKDDFDILDLMQAAGLSIVDVVEMPANNLGLIAQRPEP